MIDAKRGRDIKQYNIDAGSATGIFTIENRQIYYINKNTILCGIL